MRVWISDGSAVTWRDTEKLAARPPRLLAKFFGRRYEGLLDAGVGVGTKQIGWREGDGIDGEAEWAVEFKEALADLEPNDETPCELKGMIEGKWMRPMLQPGEIDWGPATIGNNVITTDGITTCLGELAGRGGSSLESVKLEVTFTSHRGDLVRHETCARMLTGVPVAALASEVGGWSRRNRGKGDLYVLNLAAVGPKAAYVNSTLRQAISLSAALGPMLLRKLWRREPRGAIDVVNNARTAMFKRLLKYGAFAKRGEPLELRMTDGSRVVGAATLTVA